MLDVCGLPKPPVLPTAPNGRCKRLSYVRKRWTERYQELVVFKETHGHCRVPQMQPGLGEWVKRQRQHLKKGHMSLEDYEDLLKIGFIFDGVSDKWSRSFKRLECFSQEFGHCCVPDGDSDINKRYPELAAWVRQQRHFQRTGQLSRDRFKRLDKIGFVWDLQSERFEQWFAQLLEFKSKYGHCNVPSTFPEQQPLASWVHNIRKRYRERCDMQTTMPITESQEARLLKIGFQFGPKGKRWEEHFQMLKALIQEQGSIPDPLPNAGKHKGLRTWAQNQRRLHQQGQLSLDHWRRLNLVHFVWDPEEVAWNERLALLKSISHSIGFQTAYLSLDLMNGEPFLLAGGPSHRGNMLYGLGVSRSAVEDLIDWYGESKAAMERGELPGSWVEQIRGLGFDWQPVQAGKEILDDCLMHVS
ncbi:hypothetical protein BSKO_05229 [Bryopsis sp. KO-2023]|nr:hypothetical protein BSKO_05229 [Bryopsis sp. KO-2023]